MNLLFNNKIWMRYSYFKLSMLLPPLLAMLLLRSISSLHLFRHRSSSGHRQHLANGQDRFREKLADLKEVI